MPKGSKEPLSPCSRKRNGTVTGGTGPLAGTVFFVPHTNPLVKQEAQASKPSDPGISLLRLHEENLNTENCLLQCLLWEWSKGKQFKCPANMGKPSRWWHLRQMKFYLGIKSDCAIYTCPQNNETLREKRTCTVSVCWKWQTATKREKERAK